MKTELFKLEAVFTPWIDFHKRVQFFINAPIQFVMNEVDIIAARFYVWNVLYKLYVVSLKAQNMIYFTSKHEILRSISL